MNSSGVPGAVTENSTSMASGVPPTVAENSVLLNSAQSAGQSQQSQKTVTQPPSALTAPKTITINNTVISSTSKPHSESLNNFKSVSAGSGPKSKSPFSDSLPRDSVYGSLLATCNPSISAKALIPPSSALSLMPPPLQLLESGPQAVVTSGSFSGAVPDMLTGVAAMGSLRLCPVPSSGVEGSKLAAVTGGGANFGGTTGALTVEGNLQSGY